ncbi:MAG: DUF1080 domain-containing protein [Pirellulales bacterium]|nr:DUF1080 domain-containing protein [Pirellulales bacterium]
MGILVATPVSFAEDKDNQTEVGRNRRVTKRPLDLGKEIAIFDGKTLKGWRIANTFDFEQHGKVEVRDGSIHLESGRPATGIAITTEIPKSNYEIFFRGRRVAGNDFFCGLTFPVKEQHCTLVLGGWGGKLVGLSNIDSFSAAENDTTRVFDFENGKWQDVRLRVTDDFIRIWLNDRKIIEVDVQQHNFSIYWAQEPIRPFGLATWNTYGELKDLKMYQLKSEASGNLLRTRG